ncbi:MAG: hypothetical protein GTO03_08370, partial [Planctomycetales bacterium]|nr:hypothetical protein [Planctomycetales bacterium]
NIAPTQPILVVRRPIGSDRREAALVRWGLIPRWATDPRLGNRMINARSETVDSKPAFRQAFRKRRCLVVTDGYYEWQATGGPKQPYYFHRADHRPFAFAGLWEAWSGGPAGGDSVESATIITTTANELSRKIHDRMPVILPQANYDTWLDCDQEDLPAVQALLGPVAEDFLVADPVSTQVNKPSHDSPTCIEPLRTGGA